ncbi:MAG: hypothetical protein A3K26_05465 [Tenericutes bacterium RIFOXYA12_FULL_35_10]|nr:MAG: hypothetical protein A3K26_05465 [Tenericutes bacterium RIFOXYA12_FULL_35_10]
MRKFLMILAFLFLSIGIASCTGTQNVKVSFEENGGIELEDIEISINSTSVQLPDPTREGYTFDGWFLDAELTQPFTLASLLTQSGALTLYAKWIEDVEMFSLTYQTNGGTSISSETHPAGATITAPTDPTKEGYTFGGWYADEALTTVFTFATMPAANVTVYAKWVAVITEQTITFEENGGSAVANITQTIGSVVTAPIHPTKEGYTFGGWYTDATLVTAYTFTVMPSTALTLYAKWTVNNYTISFEENGGSVVNDITQAFATTVTAPTEPTKEGNTFGGWYTDVALTTAYTFTTMPSANTTLYAKWTINNYTITFEENGGSVVTDITQAFGTAVVVPTNPTKEGMVFIGWYSDIALTTAYTFATMPSANTTLYAKWDYETYTITYLSVEGINPQNVKAFDPITLPTPVKTGYTFEGWFIDQYYLNAFEQTTMPESDLTLYAKWALATYAVTYQTNGGTTIDPVEAIYQMEIPVPQDPTKEGYTFAGWYTDSSLTEQLTDQAMPANAITLYAKWVAVDAVWSIADILLYQPGHVKVEGTVVYKFPMGQPGYYITDGTGIIFVLAPADVTLGTIYSFEADFSFFEYVPQLTNQTNRMVVSGTPDTVTHTDISISSISRSNPSDISMMGMPVIIEGVLYEDMGQYFLVEPGSENGVAINYKSIDPMNNPFNGYAGYRFKMRAFVHGFDPMKQMWHVVYDPVMPAEIVNLSEQQKVDELIAFAVNELDGKVFYSHQKLELPSVEPVYGAGLSFITTGENASYFNPSSGEFLETIIERDIVIHITVTINSIVGEVDVTITLMPTTVLSITEFGLLDDQAYGVVEGIVILSSFDMKLMIIADETGAILAIETDDYLDVGTRVHVHGYKVNMMGLTIMAGMEDSIVATLETGLPNPLTAIPLTIGQFNTLDTMNTLYWGRYYEVMGTLTWDEVSHMFYLEDAVDIMPIMVFGMDVYEQLIPFDGFEVGLRGFGLPNFDDEPFMMFIFIGAEGDIILDYTDQELADLFALMLKGYLEGETVVPGQTLMLPTEHPTFALTVSYTVDALDDALVSDLWVIDPSISVETYITIHATLTYGLATQQVVIELHVIPITTTSIYDFLHMTDSNMYYIQGVIMYIDHEEKMAIIADDTGVIMASIDMPDLMVGDEVVLYGMRMVAEEMIIIANNPSDIVQQVIAHGQDIPLVPTLYTVDEIYALGPQDPMVALSYVEIMGTLVKDGMNEIYFVTNDSEDAVYIFTIEFDDLTVLNSYVGQEVRIKGLWMHQGPEGMIVVIYLNQGDDINPRFTDAELVVYLANKLEEEHLYKVLRPGATYILPTTYGTYDVSVVYEVLGVNAGLYDLATGVISDTITTQTLIQIKATITVGVEVSIAEFDLIVEPIATSTIAEFLAGAENDEFVVRGVVVMQQFGDGPIIIADETGYMFIVKQLPVQLGDEIIVQGIVTLEMGLKLMWDYETTFLVEKVSMGLPNPLTPEVMTITQLNAIDMNDVSNWGRYIEVTGYMAYLKDSYYPLLRPELESPEFIPLVPVYIYQSSIFPDPEMLYQYDGFRLVVRAFLFPSFNEEDPYAPDRLLMVASDVDMVLDYDTDREKMDALVLLGQYKLEGKEFRPGEQLELPDVIQVLNANLSWAFVGDVSAVIDTSTMIFHEVVSQQIIQITATITIGGLTENHTFNLTVAPYPTLTFAEFMAINDNDLGKVSGVVVDVLSYYEVILQESGSDVYLYAYGFEGLTVGNDVLLFGPKFTVDGIALIYGYDDRSNQQVISSVSTEALIVSESSLDLIAGLDPNMDHSLYYYTVNGRLIFDDFSDSYFLTDGLHTIILFDVNPSVHGALNANIDKDVSIRFFPYEKTWTTLGYMWSVYVSYQTNFIQEVVYTDLDIVNIMKNYISSRINVNYKDGMSYSYEVVHPIYGGTYAFAIDSLEADKASIIDHIIHFASNMNPYDVTVYVTVTYGMESDVIPVLVHVNPYEPYEPMFIPGSAGALPMAPGVTPVGEFAGLYIHKVERQTSYMGGDEMVVDLYFPYPFDLGVEYYMIQYYDSLSSSWVYIEDYEGPIRSYYDNFSLVMSGGMTMRLVTDTGLVSNEVSFNYTDIDTRFAGYYLDMSMDMDGPMYPFVGYRMELGDISIYDLMGQPITGGYSLQWYRINPYTFEETIIVGATNSVYVTTMSDVGYYLMVEVMGDGVHVGGMMRILVEDSPKIFNEGYITNVTNMGFDIGFLYEISLIELQDIIQIMNAFGGELTYYSIETTATPNVYHVNINLIGVEEMFVSIENQVMIVGQNTEYHMMQGLYAYVYEW